MEGHCIPHGEVAILLNLRLSQMQPHDAAAPATAALTKSLYYVNKFSRYHNPDTVRQVRHILSRLPLSDLEIALLANFCPDSVDEAFALVPSLMDKARGIHHDALQNVLADLSLVKKFD
ncbi:hypothetical protein RND81_05G188200 [Saponaria officinalis]|uniref:RNA polymerase Rpb4/RPC9 core domain-containing protein n=1 Tax=Saponaria officinalis TaxID=3572 RepID=A0AAW1KYV7_SAPOF